MNKVDIFYHEHKWKQLLWYSILRMPNKIHTRYLTDKEVESMVTATQEQVDEILRELIYNQQ